MSECERIGDLFGELHDNQADGAIEKQARAHLYECPDAVRTLSGTESQSRH